jgi:hypothetical protein
MLEVDDSQLSDDDREFLIRWAEALKVPQPVLLGRILLAAIDGQGNYTEGRPRD